jgi:hypothetical protein
MLLEVVQTLSCADNAIFSDEQKEAMKMPCFMRREI